MKLYKIPLLLIAITLASCGAIPTQAKLVLPPDLAVPASLKIQANEIECLTDETVNKFIKRDKLKDARINTLSDIIRTTH